MNISITELKKNFEGVIDAVITTQKAITITKWGKPIAKLEPFSKDEIILEELKGSLIKYQDPLESIGLNDWKE